jgi:biopolymer transport protein TolR
MAGGVMSGPARGRNGRRGAYKPMAEINVTPMVDVMLVLLIVFMISAPLLATGLPVDLPQAKAPALNEQKDSVTITVNAEGKIYLSNDDRPIEDDALVPRLQALLKANPNASVYVRGDQGINYGRVMQVMGLLNSAGFAKVGLVTDMPRDRAPRKG